MMNSISTNFSRIIFLALFFFGLASCLELSGKEKNIKGVDTATPPTTSSDQLQTDSLIIYSNDSFEDVEIEFRPVAKEYFDSQMHHAESKSFETCGIHLQIYTDCDEICESYLIDPVSKKSALLPCDYDSGIQDVQVSPQCDYIAVCSSYDGSDYEEYYENRSELFFFNLSGGKALENIQPFKRFASKDYSIAAFFWGKEGQLLLKVYTHNNGESNGSFSYLEATFI